MRSAPLDATPPAPRTRRSLVPARRKPLSETWLDWKDRHGSGRLDAQGDKAVLDTLLSSPGKHAGIGAEELFLAQRISTASFTSLQFRKVGKFRSVRIGLAHRALAVEDGDDFIWVWIGTHDEYQRMLK